MCVCVFFTLLISVLLILIPKALILGEDAPGSEFLFARKMLDKMLDPCVFLFES